MHASLDSLQSFPIIKAIIDTGIYSTSEIVSQCVAEVVEGIVLSQYSLFRRISASGGNENKNVDEHYYEWRSGYGEYSPMGWQDIVDSGSKAVTG
ncbi:hypothetical protein K8T06_08215 [bacterium]|nr:hypothetical protein [bacterium]